MRAISREQIEEMNEQEKQDFVLINVLPRSEFNKAHIRTSINIPLERSDFEDVVEEVAGSRDRDVIVYCANFDCDASQKAARKLDSAGFARVFDYEGGTEDWLKNHPRR